LPIKARPTKQNTKKGHLKCNAFHNLISYGNRKPNHVYNRTSHELTDYQTYQASPRLLLTYLLTYLSTYLPTIIIKAATWMGWGGRGRGREGRFFFQCNKRWKLEDLKQLQQVGT
jgi:hypothetical protein